MSSCYLFDREDDRDNAEAQWETTYVDAGEDGESASLPLVLDLEKTRLELLKLLLGDDAVLGVGAGKGNAAKDVLLVEHTIEQDALVLLDHIRIKATGNQPPQSMLPSGLELEAMAADYVCE